MHLSLDMLGLRCTTTAVVLTMCMFACRAYLLPEDFVLFFDGDEESAHDAFDYFDRNKDGSISCTELQVCETCLPVC